MNLNTYGFQSNFGNAPDTFHCEQYFNKIQILTVYTYKRYENNYFLEISFQCFTNRGLLNSILFVY